MAVLGLRFCARAPPSCGKRGPLPIAVRGPLTIAASLAAEHRLQTRRLSNCGPQAQLLHGMWDLPRPGLEPVSPALAGRFSTTALSSFVFIISCCPGFETNALIKVSGIMWDRKILTDILISLTHTNINKCISLHYWDSSRKNKMYIQTCLYFGLFIIKVELLMLYSLERIAKCYSISIT